MTVSSTTTKNSYSGNGSTTVFAYTFKIFDEDDIAVVLRNNTTGAESTQTITTHYTVSGVGNTGGGNITFVTAPTSSQTVVLLRATPLTQLTDYTPNDPFPAETHEEALDKLTHITQELSEEVGRSLKLSQTNEIATAEFTTGAADRANKILGFDTNGDLAIFQEIGTYKGTDATTTTADYVERDIVKSTTTAQLDNVYIALQDSPTGTLLTNTTYWALLVDAVSAATSATNAANSASAAATSETNAATSETNAAASYDSFDDRYLGAKASDPALDNDGDALITGALYFNTTDGDMRVYNGSAWINVVSSLGNLANIVEDTTPQLGGDLDINGQSIVSTSNGNIAITPNGTGEVDISKVDIDSGAIDGVTLGTNSAVTEAQIDNINIDGNTITSTNTDGDITLTPNGAGNVTLGTLTFDADQTVGVSQDNYVLTYDNAAGTIGLEASAGGGGGLADVVDDTSPQLGGNLDSNGSDIVMADDDAVIIGTDTDLTILHDSGVNNTLFKSDSLEFKSKANANLTFKISPGATKAATLYYQGSERLAIESGTTRFTGGINADTATIASLSYPTSDGAADQVLKTDGAGTLSFGAAAAGGAGYFQGENGATGDTTNGKGDIFRVHEQQLDTDVTIASGDNALCAGPLTVASTVTLTVNGNLVVA